MIITFLTAFLFSTAGFINAVYAKSFDDINIIPTFILNPLIYLGGTFYPIEALPDVWREASIFNPIAYLVSSFRYGFLDLVETDLTISLLIIGSLTFILYIIALTLLTKGVGIKN